MPRIISVAIGLVALRAAIASPVAEVHPAVITPSPVLQKREYPPGFVGYAYYDDGSVESYSCYSPYTYTISNGYAGCVGGDLYLGMDCGGGDIITFADGASAPCVSEQPYCVTNAILYSADDMNPAANIACATKPVGLKILRTSDVAIQSLEKLTIEKTVTPSPTASPIPETPQTPTNPSTTSTPSPTSTGPAGIVTPTPSPKKNNAPIIGGAVGGALVLVGLVGLGLFLFFRKRSNGNHTPNPGGFGDQNNQPTPLSPNPQSPQPYAPAMAQAYAPPAGFQPGIMYQPSPVGSVPGSPPPVYGQEKSASATVMTSPVQKSEYRLPEGTSEVHGISSPGQPNQPRVTELA